jgi:hypothetical protein
MKKILFTLIALLPLIGHAELVVVAGSQSPITSLTENEVRQLFSGQLRSIGGQRVQPLDLTATDNNRETFYRSLMGRSPDQMRAYWTRLIFTGQGQPPREVSNARELATLATSSPEYIGYLPASEVSNNLRIIYRLR